MNGLKVWGSCIMERTVKKNLIDIVIPSYNSKKTIIQCLQSVLNQSYKKPYKVIVVDSSDDESDKIIKKYFPEIHFIHIDIKTLPGEARNIGVRESFSDFIAFTDTDCIVDYYWIDRIMERINSHCFDAVGGSILNGTSDDIIGTLGYLNEFSFFMPIMKSGFVKAIATANVCYKSNIFHNQHFIDYSFAGEDTIFHWTILANGGNIFFDPEIKVIHLNRTGLINILKHQLKMGQGAGIARIIMNKDTVLIHFPVLCILLLPWIRIFRMNKRIFLNDKKFWRKIIRYFPLSLLISYAWCVGFYHSIKTSKSKRTALIDTAFFFWVKKSFFSTTQ